MKNIHIIPTDKPSRLFYSGNSSKLTLNKYSVLFRVSPQNIYITNDEEIKDGERGISINNSIYTHYDYLGKTYGKKIILTTDQDLIKDGVQAINDEFLEWFVKNPTCEEVVVIKEYFWEDTFRGYSLRLPKEEPKNICIQTGLPCGMQCLSEDTCNRTLEEVVNNFKKTDVYIKEIKQEQERSYSEEEVIQLVSDWTDYRMSEDTKSKVTFKKWFKQFKE